MAPNPSPKTITQWMEVFSKLYSEPDSKRTPEQLWIAVMAHSSSIGEEIRKVHFPELLKYAAHAFCWLCSFVNRCKSTHSPIFSLHESLSGIVSLKYPRECGHCGGKPCRCFASKIDARDDKGAPYEDLFKTRKSVLKSVEAYSVDDWRNILADIYGEQVHVLSLDSIGFHFLEEVGEAATAVRKLSQLKRVLDQKIDGVNESFLTDLITVEGIVKNYESCKRDGVSYESRDSDMIKWRIVEAKMSLLIEIGDTFSWFCSILNKLDSISDNCNLRLPTLEENLSSEYLDKAGQPKCPTCEKDTCQCVFFS